jgi:hypothetical protein
MRRWEDNIRTDLQRIVCEGNNQISLAQCKMVGSCDYVDVFHNTGKISRSAELQ